MNREAMRTLLRREIRDNPEQQWSDSELNDMLNISFLLVQKEVVKIDREAHLSWDYMDATSGVAWYPLPQTFGVSAISAKFAASDTTFTALRRKRYADIKDLSGTTHYYARRGQWFSVYPTPTVTITNGIELVHTPMYQMSADSDVPRIKLPLHITIVLWAKLLLLGETDEQHEDTKTRINEAILDIPNWYSADSDEADKLIVEA
jgi:hypothetical protein